MVITLKLKSDAYTPLKSVVHIRAQISLLSRVHAER
jgi:hypothetical protein